MFRVFAGAATPKPKKPLWASRRSGLVMKTRDPGSTFLTGDGIIEATVMLLGFGRV